MRDDAAAPPAKHRSLDWVLFALSLGIFLATRLIGLADFPIYFFTDEAANTVQAADFLNNEFRDTSGQFFPTYFANNEKLSLGVSVYAQVIPYALFGYSVFVTRATSVLIALSAMVAVGLMLRDIFKIRLWWSGVLLLSITPAWFLHTRTAFETVMMASFYAWFLYFYQRYRHGQAHSLLAALLFGSLAFYSYTTGQPSVVLSGLLLLIVDWRYHRETFRRDPRLGWIVLALITLFALPYLRFQMEHPDQITQRLQLLDSYWLRDIPLTEKLGQFAGEYLYGLSPNYWYRPDNPTDLIRHQMKGYANLLLVTLPFGVIGLVACLRQIRSPAQRVVFIGAVTAPIGSALTSIHITRVLVFVIPVTIFTAIGLSAVLTQMSRRIAYGRLAVALCFALCAINLAMLRDALVNGPTWYANYGLAGMQYGAKEVFEEIRAYLERSPDTQVWVFPTWLNGADALRRFFLPDDPRLQLRDFESFLNEKLGLHDGLLFVVAREEYRRIAADPKFADVRVERTLNLPDGTPGFYFLHLRYSPEADALFASEHTAREQLVAEDIPLHGQVVTVRHTPFSAGGILDVFDGDRRTFAQTRRANPVVLELAFLEPRRLTGVALTTGSKDIYLTIYLFGGENSQPGRYASSFTNLSSTSALDLIFDPAPGPVTKIRIEIKGTSAFSASSVQIYEIDLRE